MFNIEIMLSLILSKCTYSHALVAYCPSDMEFYLYLSMVSVFPPISKDTLTFTDVSVLKGNIESSAKSLGRYIKYLPSFLLNTLPLPELVRFYCPSF